MSAPFKPDENARPLTRAELDAALDRIDFTHGRGLQAQAERLAGDIAGDGKDLLHDAIYRTLKSRQCKTGITVERFLWGVMRSLASTKKRSIERGRENHVFMPPEEIAAHLGGGPYAARSAEELIEIERVRDLCAEILERLADKSAAQAALIEGIGLDLRGQELAEHVGVSREELATIRRALKRHAERLWPQFVTDLSRPEAPDD